MWIFKRDKLLLGSSTIRSLDIRHPRPFERWARALGPVDRLTTENIGWDESSCGRQGSGARIIATLPRTGAERVFRVRVMSDSLLPCHTRPRVCMGHIMALWALGQAITLHKMFRALLVVFVVVVRYFFSHFIFTNFTRKYWRLMNFDKKKTPLEQQIQKMNCEWWVVWLDWKFYLFDTVHMIHMIQYVIPCAMGKITWDVGKIENSNPRKVKIIHLLIFAWHFDK